MKTSIALVSAALLLGAALARPAPDLRRPLPSKPLTTPPATKVVEAPEQPTSFFETLLGAVLPPPEAEPQMISEIILLHDRRDTAEELAALERELLDEDLGPRGIRRKLETMKIDLAFENTKLEDILAFIRDFSGLNILLDAKVRDHIDPDRAITFKVKDLVLKKTLKLLLAPYQLDYRITEEDVVLITDPGLAATASPPSFFSIQNINSPGPAIDPTPFDAVLAATRVDLDVQNWPLSAIVEELRRRTGLDLRMSSEIEGYISVNARQMSLPQLLTSLLSPRNATYRIDGVTIWIGLVKGT